MAKKENKEFKSTVSEALQTLSSIAELGEKETQHIPAYKLEKIKPLSRKIQKIRDIEKKLSVSRVKDLFQTILRYMQFIYEEDSKPAEDRVESIRSIMVLVGKAAKKLDRYTNLFHKKSVSSVTDLKEYKRLQEFYTRKVEKKVDEGTLSKWIFGLVQAGPSKQALRKARARKREKSQHVFVDLDMVKKDTEYELLLMRKEDGSRFFNPRLLRNLKLVCDFGGYTADEDDIFAKVYDWRDILCHVASLNMLHTLKLTLKRFYQEAYRHKKQDHVSALNKAIMALMLTADTHNLAVNKKNKDSKSCIHFFADFQNYLRDALNTRYYQKLMAYPPKPSNVLGNCLLSVTRHLCRAFYLHTHIIQEMFLRVHEILDETRKYVPATGAAAAERGVFLWSRLAYDYAEIVKSFQKHANGPLRRIFESLESGQYTSFDSIQQFNYPHAWFDIFVGDERIVHLRMPSPTRQVLINKAVVLDEFKSFLLSQNQRGLPTSHLLINLQDRTSWREFSRTQALEQFQNSSLFKDHVKVATLAVDTEFYHQIGPYESQDDSEDFIQVIKDQLKSSSSGYYFPQEIKTPLLAKFIDEAAEGIHQFFFNGEQFLSTKDRQSFITLLHLFIELKLIDLIGPSSFSLSCKDAIDIGGAASVLMFAFYNLLQKPEATGREVEFIESMIYGPAVLIRERAMLPDPINRALGALQVIESKREGLGFDSYRDKLHQTFDALFDGDILRGKIHIPLIEVEREVPEAA